MADWVPGISPNQKRINDALAASNLVGTHADKVVNLPGNALAQYLDSGKPILYRKLNENFYYYGLNVQKWTWHESGANGGMGADIGGPLLRGEGGNAYNCGRFNDAVRRIAMSVLGFSADDCASASTPLATGKGFLTKPGTVTIDPSWPGNVRTLTTDFGALKSAFFTTHAYSKSEGKYFDASTGLFAFDGPDDFTWCKVSTWQGGQSWVFKVETVVSNQSDLPGPGPHYLVRIPKLRDYIAGDSSPKSKALAPQLASFASTTGNGNWGTLVLLSSADMPPGLLPANTWVSARVT